MTGFSLAARLNPQPDLTSYCNSSAEKSVQRVDEWIPPPPPFITIHSPVTTTKNMSYTHRQSIREEPHTPTPPDFAHHGAGWTREGKFLFFKAHKSAQTILQKRRAIYIPADSFPPHLPTPDNLPYSAFAARRPTDQQTDRPTDRPGGATTKYGKVSPGGHTSSRASDRMQRMDRSRGGRGGLHQRR